MPGRKKRLSRYLSAGLKRVKNIATRRTKVATIHRDLHKLSTANSNKRLKKNK
jgi:hypothetical protein